VEFTISIRPDETLLLHTGRNSESLKPNDCAANSRKKLSLERKFWKRRWYQRSQEQAMLKFHLAQKPYDSDLAGQSTKKKLQPETTSPFIVF